MSHLIPRVDSPAPGPSLASGLALHPSLSLSVRLKSSGSGCLPKPVPLPQELSVPTGLGVGRGDGELLMQAHQLLETLAENSKLDDSFHFSIQVETNRNLYPPLPVSTGWCEQGPPAAPQQGRRQQDLLKWPMIQRSPDFTHGQLPSPSSLRPKDSPSPVLSETSHLPGFRLGTPKLNTDSLAAWVTGSRGTGFSPCHGDEDKFSLPP
ncbi:uncharacterized protein LOC112135488 [Pongo abelii]|uniref:uncharacterized protein LOC112135488 n=1 Tax=Pongo abelii TaxID=9601 RepID=UPI0023E8F547|nr:uncharacterized protein LOC129048891 [Pongo abelii]